MEWGEDVKAISKDEAVMLVNHQATGDVCTLMMCLQDKGLVSALKAEINCRQGSLTKNQLKQLLWSGM